MEAPRLIAGNKCGTCFHEYTTDHVCPRCDCGSVANFGPMCSACYVAQSPPRPKPWEPVKLPTDVDVLVHLTLLLGHAKQQTALLKRLVEIAEKERGA